MMFGSKSKAAKRRSIARATLETAIADAVRNSDQLCVQFVGVIVERVAPKSSDGANWAVKGIRYGKADRERCETALSGVVEEGLQKFELAD